MRHRVRPPGAFLVLVAAIAGATASRAVELEGHVPIVLSLAGLKGSFYTSELTLTNRGAAPLTVTLTYNAAFGGGSGIAADR